MAVSCVWLTVAAPFDKSLKGFNPCLTTRCGLMDWLFIKITKSFQNRDLNSSQHTHARDNVPETVGVPLYFWMTMGLTSGFVGNS